MPAPVHRLKKSEIVWLANNKCVAHCHDYLGHYNCYLLENPNRQPKIGYFDIESTDLVANFGIMLSYCIKDGASDKIYSDVIRKSDLGNEFEDKRLVQNCIRDLGRFDRIVTFYGTRFDIPFVRTRAVHAGIDFPNYGTLVHTDLYFIIRNRFRLRRNGLESACRTLLNKTDKTHINEKVWRKAGRGDAKALAYVLEHNKFDVLDTEKLYNKVTNYFMRRDTSV